ncbi:MAG: hypothetical protein SV375_20390 [Thermodesulfobacteriota bacterium]|nr:hypothetical protein [Thermodesulfobacteriota bacterium]
MITKKSRFILITSPFSNILWYLFVSKHGADPRARRVGAGRRPGHTWGAQSGQVACSGARRRGKALDGVSAAFPGGEAAGNDGH